MKVPVTGAAGFTGARLVDRVVSEGHPVVGVDRFTACYDSSQKRENAAEVARLRNARA
jgi:UDP-glucuronate 4-epimerase